MLNITIDPGHGGYDTGCVYGDIVESDYNLNLALRLAKMLKHTDEVSVKFTRIAYNEALTLHQRGIKAIDNNADIVISLHVNADTTGNQRGTILFCSGAPIVRDTCNIIAQCVPTALQRTGKQVFKTSASDWTHRAYNVISTYSMPAMLVETGFASNETDNIELKTESVQIGLCSAIIAGIAHYMYVIGD